MCRNYKLTNNLLSLIILDIKVGNEKIPGAYDKEYKESPGMEHKKRMEGLL